jgi:hypothetical protein
MIHKLASKWGRFEARAARKAELKAVLSQHCSAEMQTSCHEGCPFKRFKCLQSQSSSLSKACNSAVEKLNTEMRVHKTAHDTMKRAHKACKKHFKQMAHACHRKLPCIAKAKAAKRACHHQANTQPPTPKQQQELTTSGATTYRHQIVTSPGNHCLEITIPGGNDSPFWKDEGWKYSAPDRPEWVEGKCDYTKWKTQDSRTDNYDGYTAAKNSPYDAVHLIKYGMGPGIEEAQTNLQHILDPHNLMTLALLLLLLLTGVLCCHLKRRQSPRYTLEAMHLAVVTPKGSEDQL